MRIVIEPIGEKPHDIVAAEFAGRERDAVHDQQRDVVWVGTRVAIR